MRRSLALLGVTCGCNAILGIHDFPISDAGGDGPADSGVDAGSDAPADAPPAAPCTPIRLQTSFTPTEQSAVDAAWFFSPYDTQLGPQGWNATSGETTSTKAPLTINSAATVILVAGVGLGSGTGPSLTVRYTNGSNASDVAIELKVSSVSASTPTAELRVDGNLVASTMLSGNLVERLTLMLPDPNGGSGLHATLATSAGGTSSLPFMLGSAAGPIGFSLQAGALGGEIAEVDACF
jgi:hypothetical protein